MSRQSPYADNGGSVVAIAGADFAAVGADSRLSQGYSILSRDTARGEALTPLAVLAAAGCWCDALTLRRLARARLTAYRHEHRRQLATPALAQLLSTMLYSRRFFPLYVSAVLAGVDPQGRGCVFSYDPIGHYERCGYRASGSAGALMQPLLDSQVGGKNDTTAPQPAPLPTKEEALAMIKDAFVSAAERDIHTGDSVVIQIITANGIEEEVFQLRKD